MDRSHHVRPPNTLTAPISLTPIAARLLSHSVAGPNGCIVWTGYTDNEGYGKITVHNRGRYAHRIAHEELVGAVPKGMQLDHLCHTKDATCGGGRTCMHRRCINPLHLEVVTARENSIRANNSFVSINAHKTRCGSGHEFTPENTYVRTNGTRRCVECQREWTRRYQAKRSAMRKAGAR